MSLGGTYYRITDTGTHHWSRMAGTTYNSDIDICTYRIWNTDRQEFQRKGGLMWIRLLKITGFSLFVILMWTYLGYFGLFIALLAYFIEA